MPKKTDQAFINKIKSLQIVTGGGAKKPQAKTEWKVEGVGFGMAVCAGCAEPTPALGVKIRRVPVKPAREREERSLSA